MIQTRLFARMRRSEADRAFAALDVEFEDDGLPLAVTEIDEAEDIHEISLYADSDEVDATVAHADAALDRSGLAHRMQSEAIPDIDWVAKYAHIPVLATDIDPIAIRVTDANIRLNGAKSYVDTQVATDFHHRAFAAYAPYDLIVANILAGPLMKLAPQMARYLTGNGSVILSGILERQREAVLAAYVAQSFRHRATLHREGWVTLHLKR